MVVQSGYVLRVVPLTMDPQWLAVTLVMHGIIGKYISFPLILTNTQSMASFTYTSSSRDISNLF